MEEKAGVQIGQRAFLAYPTNPVLLICLGLAVVSYPKWLKWTAKLWFWVLLVTIAFLCIGVAIHFGPF